MKSTELFFYPRVIEIEISSSKSQRKKGITSLIKTGKRQTVAGLIKDNKIQIGVATCSYNDKFTKKEGRAEAIKKATEKPSLVVDIINEKKVSRQFIYAAKMVLNLT